MAFVSTATATTTTTSTTTLPTTVGQYDKMFVGRDEKNVKHSNGDVIEVITTSSSSADTHIDVDSEADTDTDDWMILWLLRLLFMTYFMAIGTLQPFLSVYYHSLGYDGNIIGVLGSINPMTIFLVAPIWGVVSDRSNKPFAVLCITTVLSLIGQVSVRFCNDYRAIMVMVCAHSIFSAPVKPLIDSLAIGNLRDRSQFGRLRLWSLIGTGIASSISGRFLSTGGKNDTEIDLVVDMTTTSSSFLFRHLENFWKNLYGYNLIFFAYTVLHIPTFLAIWMVRKVHRKNMQKKDGMNDNTTKQQNSAPENSRPIKNVLKLIFRDKEVVLFFFLVFSLGMSAAVGDSFAYVRFKEVGGTGTDMGMSRLLCSLAGAVMFWYSGKIGAYLGMERVMIFSLVSVATRFALFSRMDSPWYGYVGEMIRGMTFGCFWSTSTVYASKLAPPEVQATTLQLLNGMYNGIGRSAGAILGGRLQATLGTTVMFKYFSIWNYALAMLLFLYKEVYFDRRVAHHVGDTKSN